MFFFLRVIDIIFRLIITIIKSTFFYGICFYFFNFFFYIKVYGEFYHLDHKTVSSLNYERNVKILHSLKIKTKA